MDITDKLQKWEGRINMLAEKIEKVKANGESFAEKELLVQPIEAVWGTWCP